MNNEALAQKLADAVEVALGDDGHSVVYKRLAVVDAIRSALPVAQGEAVSKEPSPEFTEWLLREIPPGTVISSPKWWLPKIWRRATDGLYAAHPAADARIAPCKCDFRTKMVGDGCYICNPEKYAEIMSAQASDDADRIAELEREVEKLRGELSNIANAKPSEWEPDMRDQFQQWAQSRARQALAAQEKNHV